MSYKGKERAVDPSSISPPAVSLAISEALSTPITTTSLSSSPESTSTSSHSYSEADATPLSPISRPPQAHQPSSLRPMPPRLLSGLGLTRSTLPTSSLSCASAGVPVQRTVSDPAKPGESSRSVTAWMSAGPVGDLYDEPFPDLDPSTGLPLARAERSVDTTSGPSTDRSPSLHLQRTITGLLATDSGDNTGLLSFSIPKVQGIGFNLPSLPSVSMPTVNMPSLKSMPSIPSLPSLPSIPGLPGRMSMESNGSRRSISTSSTEQDWGTWASGLWSGGSNRKHDESLAKDDQGDTVEEEEEKHRRKYRTPKNPIVFCHGLLGFDFLGPANVPVLQINHWRGIREVLEANGVEVLMARVAATASIADRAATLEELIAANFPGRQVNLVGHSMGGLDCRYLVSQIQPKAFTPVSVTTISTPHRGSPFADYVIDNVIGRERLPSLLSVMESLKLPQSGDGSAFNALGTRSMRLFNSEVIDREDVKYYSWGASFEPGLLDTFKWPHGVILAKEGANDGLVSVSSAKWGEYRGTLLGVNHLDLVGWVNHVRYVLSGWTGKPITFKPATFYLEVADYLAEQGF